MNQIISKTIKIKCEFLPPKVDFIEEQIKSQGLEAVRWAIVGIEDNILILSVSGFYI